MLNYLKLLKGFVFCTELGLDVLNFLNCLCLFCRVLREIVRKKAVMTLHRFLCIAPAQLSNMQDTFRQILCDRDPGVMAASLHIFHDLVRVS